MRLKHLTQYISLHTFNLPFFFSKTGHRAIKIEFFVILRKARNLKDRNCLDKNGRRIFFRENFRRDIVDEVIESIAPQW